jgi:membrane protein
MAERRDDHGRGRHSEQPSQIPKPGWRDVLLRTWDQISKDNVSLVAAGVAFYGLLAIFPALAALISVYGLFADPAQVEQQLQASASVMPGGANSILGDQLRRVSGHSNGALGLAAIVSFLIALWSTGSGTKSFMAAMNIAYGEDEKRGLIWYNLVALALTLFIIVFGALALAFVAIIPAVLGQGNVGTLLNWAVSLLRWPLIAVIFIFALTVLYRFAPDREQPKWRWVSPGSVAAALIWLVVSVAFSIYVRNFGSYNKTYGSLGAVAATMMWFWISAYVVIAGAELNAETERQTRRDTTTGESKPMGERGAYAADTVGESR